MGFGEKERWVHPWVIDEDSSRSIITVTLTPEEVAFLEEPYVPHSVVGAL